jgi:hypothetical protein
MSSISAALPSMYAARSCLEQSGQLVLACCIAGPIIGISRAVITQYDVVLVRLAARDHDVQVVVVRRVRRCFESLAAGDAQITLVRVAAGNQCGDRRRELLDCRSQVRRSWVDCSQDGCDVDLDQLAGEAESGDAEQGAGGGERGRERGVVQLGPDRAEIFPRRADHIDDSPYYVLRPGAGRFERGQDVLDDLLGLAREPAFREVARLPQRALPGEEHQSVRLDLGHVVIAGCRMQPGRVRTLDRHAPRQRHQRPGVNGISRCSTAGTSCTGHDIEGDHHRFASRCKPPRWDRREARTPT